MNNDIESPEFKQAGYELLTAITKLLCAKLPPADLLSAVKAITEEANPNIVFIAARSVEATKHARSAPVSPETIQTVVDLMIEVSAPRADPELTRLMDGPTLPSTDFDRTLNSLVGDLGRERIKRLPTMNAASLCGYLANKILESGLDANEEQRALLEALHTQSYASTLAHHDECRALLLEQDDDNGMRLQCFDLLEIFSYAFHRKVITNLDTPHEELRAKAKAYPEAVRKNIHEALVEDKLVAGYMSEAAYDGYVAILENTDAA